MRRARGLLPMWLRLRWLRVRRRLGVLGRRRIRVCGLRLLRAGRILYSASGGCQNHMHKRHNGQDRVKLIETGYNSIRTDIRTITYRKDLSPIPSIPLTSHQIPRIRRTRLHSLRIHPICRTPMRMRLRTHTSRPRTLANHRIRFGRTSRAHCLPLMLRRLPSSAQLLPPRTLCLGFGARLG